MKKLIIFLLFAILFTSCGVYEYYPDKIIKYRGKCLRMQPHPMFGGTTGRVKHHRLMRKNFRSRGHYP